MNRLTILYGAIILIGVIGLGSPALAKKKKSTAASPSDAVYTGTTNLVAANEPITPSTNAPTKTEPAKPTTNAATETEPSKPVTNSPTEPVPPIIKIDAKSDSTASSTNHVSKPAPPASTNMVVTPTEPVIHTATLNSADIKEYADQSPQIQALISHGLELTKRNLKYQYGSDDPKNGGMDCSGTVYYLLKESGIKDVPRDATGLYTWAWKEGHVQPVVSSNLSTFELSRLKPGDLLFWIGTYDVERDPPISHVMIYLGTNRLTGKPVMVGASEGRTYKGKSQYGVSVFDFVLPKAATKVGEREYQGRFIGYGHVPGL